MSKNISGAPFEENKQIIKNIKKYKSRHNALNKSRQDSPSLPLNSNKHQHKKQHIDKCFKSTNQVLEGSCTNFSHRKEKMKKKPIANDLLAFTFERHSDLGVNGPYKHYSTKPKRFPAINKNQALQATSQVILKSGKDYSLHLADSDILFDWNEVEKLNVWSTEIPSCPICLHEATAARITCCGHIYCWSCLLQFLQHEGEDWNYCPVCGDEIHLRDLRSVTVHKDEDYKVQSNICMHLMKRSSDSVTSVVVKREYDEEKQCEVEQPAMINPIYLKNTLQRNYKYLIASLEDILDDVIECDKKQLEFELAVETDNLVTPSIEWALNLCEARKDTFLAKIIKRNKREEKLKNKLMLLKENDAVPKVVQEISSPTDLMKCKGNDDVTKESHFSNSCAGNINNSNRSACDINDVTINKSMTDLSISEKEPKQFYFYQAKDGQQMYLSQLNMKCLVHEFGGYDKLPLEIVGNILQIENFTMDQATRRQHKYMSHLPLSLKFLVIELDLCAPLLSEETLTRFKKSLDTRAEARRQRLKEEKRIIKRANYEAMIKQGKQAPARYKLSSEHQFPQISFPQADEDNLDIDLPPLPSTSQQVAATTSSSSSLSHVWVEHCHPLGKSVPIDDKIPTFNGNDFDAFPQLGKEKDNSSFAKLTETASSPREKSVWVRSSQPLSTPQNITGKKGKKKKGKKGILLYGTVSSPK